MQGSNINVIFDEHGRAIVIIHDVRFHGRQNIDWEDVERYLRGYINTNYEVLESADMVFIGTDMHQTINSIFTTWLM